MKIRIVDIKADCYRVPIELPLKRKTIDREIVVVKVNTDQGIIGYGVTGPILNKPIKTFINEQITEYLKGYDPLDTEKVYQDLYNNFNIRNLSGVWSSAVSAIDIALWDIKGKYYRESIANLLGGARKRVPAYITFGMLEYSLEELVELAKIMVKKGHDKLKMVVAINNGNNVKDDIKRVKAVREAIGENTELMVDANYIYSYSQALKLIKEIEPYDITWIEEPIYRNDYLLLADLKRKTRIPIAAGQCLGHLWDHRNLIINSAIDIAQPNVCFVGGFTEGVKVAHLAQAFNLQIAVGAGWPHHNLHLYAGVPNGWRVEFNFLSWLSCEALFKNTPTPKDGWVSVPDGYGLGFEPYPEALEEYRLK